MRYIKNIISISIILLIFQVNSIIATEKLNISNDDKELFLSADKITYNRKSKKLEATNNVEILYDDNRIYSDYILYNKKTGKISLKNDVTIFDNDNNIINTDFIDLKKDSKDLKTNDVILRSQKEKDLLLVSSFADKQGKVTKLYNNSFTACPIICNKAPLWQIDSQKTKIDNKQHKVTYKNAVFKIKNLPILYTPYFSHPTPDAPAKSGFLIPYIKHKDFILPAYFRIKDNMDFTSKLRLSRKEYVILENEFRHKIKSGQYKVILNIGNPEFVVDKDASSDVINANTNKNNGDFDRYFASISGNFTLDGKYRLYEYGVDLNRASDKAFLKNLYEKYTSYLKSKIYINSYEPKDYVNAQLMHFQELRDPSSFNSNFESDSVILAHIYKYNQYPLENNIFNSSYITIDNNLLFSFNNNNQDICRNNLLISLDTNYITNQGHIFSFGLSNRFDLYFINNNQVTDNKETLHRSIPEASIAWQYPLITNLIPNNDNINVKITPTAKIIWGKKYKSSAKDFLLIDSSKSELSEHNIFDSSKFHGYDNHDFGTRISAGIDISSQIYQDHFLDIFFGILKTQRNSNSLDKREYVSNIRLYLNDNLEIFYKFKKGEKFASILDETGINFSKGKIDAEILYSVLHNVSRNFRETNDTVTDNNVRQISINAGYDIFDNFNLSFQTIADLSKGKFKKLNRKIGATYTHDCAMINVTVFDDYTSDSPRGIKKLLKNYGFYIGLKMINM